MTRLIVISIPKSGSGMLAQAIGGNHANIGPSAYVKQPSKSSLKIMQKFTDPFARSHQPYHLAYENFYRERGDKVVFLHRDLRDTIVSHAFYIVSNWRGHKSYFNFPIGNEKLLEDAEDKILEIIKKSRWLHGRYLGWMSVDFVLDLKYEELVNTNGDKNPKGFQKFVDYLGKYAGTLGCKSPAQMIGRINPNGCNTFRKGIVGDWKNHFKKRHIELFWEKCGDMMKEFGYDAKL